jgi:hypothetical protein
MQNISLALVGERLQIATKYICLIFSEKNENKN